MVTRAHPWRLVAPWYRWARAAYPPDGRGSAPALQKFSGDAFVESFLARPQHSLVFDPEADLVSRLDAAGYAATGERRSAASMLVVNLPVYALAPIETAAEAAARIARTRAAPSDLRRLFLPTHDRHYLVTCELHCDVAGFPSPPREEACQAGFVVRRRTAVIPSGIRTEANRRTADVNTLEASLAVLESLAQEAPPAFPDTPANRLRREAEQAKRAERRESLRAAAGAASWSAYLADQRAGVARARSELRKWLVEQHVAFSVQAWLPGPDGAPPRWTRLSPLQELSDTTHGLGEEFFPLVPLVPDPRDASHDAAGRAMYFGVVPTVSSDHDPDGNARFDDKSTYEIRCFVRRHDPAIPRPQGNPDCCGAVVWSDATEPYRLAPPFDALGSAQRPVTIQMPDLAELSAQIAARPRGKLSPVRFVQPQHLSPKLDGAVPAKNPAGGPSICFHSIPLITITALFLLNIFMPIVTFVFQLWNLLALRFCIAPQVPSADLDAKLAATPPGVDVTADGTVTADEVAQRILDGVTADTGQSDAAMLPPLDARKAPALQGLAVALADNAALPASAEDVPPGLGYREERDYEPHRDPEWQVAAGGRG